MLDQAPTHANQSTTELEELRNKLALKNLKFDLMLQITQAINFNFSEKAILAIFKQLLKGELQLTDFLLLLKEEEGFQVSVHLGESLPYDARTLELNIVGVSKTQAIANGIFAPRFKWMIPVYHKTEALAMLLLGDLPWADADVRREMTDYLQTVLNVILVAFENKRLFKKQLNQEVLKNELNLAAHIQGLLIPDVLPNRHDLQFDAVYLPHNNIGGDYYDCQQIGSNEWVFCVADVSGKGIPASLLMANFQANFHALLQPPVRLDWLVQTLNRKVLSITKGEKFITLFIGLVDLKKGILTYVNAGHVPPILLRDKKCIQLDKGCTILGMFTQLPKLVLTELPIKKGDCVLAFTDGVTDIVNEKGQSMSQELLCEMLSKQQSEAYPNLARNITNELMRFKGKSAFIDDLTLLSFQIR